MIQNRSAQRNNKTTVQTLAKSYVEKVSTRWEHDCLHVRRRRQLATLQSRARYSCTLTRCADYLESHKPTMLCKLHHRVLDCLLYRLFHEQGWAEHLGHESIAWWRENTDSEALVALPLRIKLGFLNAAGDLLQHLGHRLEPFLPEICSLTLSLLEAATLKRVLSSFDIRRDACSRACWRSAGQVLKAK